MSTYEFQGFHSKQIFQYIYLSTHLNCFISHQFSYHLSLEIPLVHILFICFSSYNNKAMPVLSIVTPDHRYPFRLI
ncbi:hypothetical protein HanRHA438_Chr02g0089841 [Helianthus annuus]|nr:hypothetical protein HanRHA438_Chr02g0089841 [Helianthus annuus]